MKAGRSNCVARPTRPVTSFSAYSVAVALTTKLKPFVQAGAPGLLPSAVSETVPVTVTVVLPSLSVSVALPVTVPWVAVKVRVRLCPAARVSVPSVLLRFSEVTVAVPVPQTLFVNVPDADAPAEQSL